MTVERSWLLPDADEDDAKPEGAMWYEGWLVPDGRLEAIADVWRNFRSMNSPLLKEMTGLVVTDKLNALIEEGSDESH